MRATASRTIVVLGMMSKMPVPGVVWQTAHYIVGLELLGYEVYYVEAHARTPGNFMVDADDDGSARAASFIAGVCRRFGLGNRWAYHALHRPDAPVFGMSDSALRDVYASAALIINLHGGTEPRPEHHATGRLVFLETDPVQLQVELYQGVQASIDFLEPHCAFFTFGENYGRPGCRLPVNDRFSFRPTRQPVVMDFWQPPRCPPGACFTTIGNWRQEWRQVELDGVVYTWNKAEQFAKVLDLPARTASVDAQFELTLSSCDDAVEQTLRGHGWGVRHALAFGDDIDAYRNYVSGSRGEFTVAKDQNVRLRTGWFSDRSATYLAAGRPVITQDTGFGDVLPTGEGLLAYATLDDAVAAVERVQADYDRHASAAAGIARERFAHDVVLRDLLGALDP